MILLPASLEARRRSGGPLLSHSYLYTDKYLQLAQRPASPLISLCASALENQRCAHDLSFGSTNSVGLTFRYAAMNPWVISQEERHDVKHLGAQLNNILIAVSTREKKNRGSYC